MRRTFPLFKNTLTRRFLLVFVLIILLPVCLAGAVITVVTERGLIDTATERLAESASQTAAGIDEEAQRLALLTATLSYDSTLISSAERYNISASDEEAYSDVQPMNDRLSAFFDYTNRIGAVEVLLSQRQPYIYRNNPQIFERPVDRSEWYRAVVANKNRVYILQDLRSYSLSGGDLPVVTVAVCPSASALDHGVQAILVASRIPSLDAIGSLRDQGHLEFLTNSFGTAILSSPAGSITAGEFLAALRDQPEGHGRVLVRKRPYIVATAAIPSAGWLLVDAISYSRVTQSVDSFLTPARIAIVALLLLFALYIELFFHQILRPVRLVVEKMQLVSRGDYSATVSVGAPTEIRRLTDSFNLMVREVHRLTNEKEQNERERAALELEGLRLQINPHFLANTLNAIRLMAVMSGAENISTMTAALMRIVTESFSGGSGSLSPLATEIETLKSYVQIMKVRFGDSFDVVYNVEPALGGRFILRMLLQPIVENCILHGLQGIDRKGFIEVRARTGGGGALLIEVTDNGKGMTAEEIERSFNGQLPRDLTFNRVGIANMRRRIELNHGPGYGIAIASEPGVRTTVSARLPSILVPENGGAPCAE